MVGRVSVKNLPEIVPFLSESFVLRVDLNRLACDIYYVK